MTEKQVDIQVLLSSIPTSMLVDEIDRRAIALIPDTPDYTKAITTREMADALQIDIDFTKRVIKRLIRRGDIMAIIKLHPYTRILCGKGYVWVPKDDR